MEPSVTGNVDDAYLVPFAFVAVEEVDVMLQIFLRQDVAIGGFAFMIFLQHAQDGLCVQAETVLFLVVVKQSFALKAKNVLHISFFAKITIFFYLVPVLTRKISSHYTGPLNLVTLS